MDEEKCPQCQQKAMIDGGCGACGFSENEVRYVCHACEDTDIPCVLTMAAGGDEPEECPRTRLNNPPKWEKEEI